MDKRKIQTAINVAAVILVPLINERKRIKDHEDVQKFSAVSKEAFNKTKHAAGNVKEVKDFTIFWPDDSFKAVGTDKKVWGMREVCNTCRVSLVQNQCENPTILGGIAVKIVPR